MPSFKDCKSSGLLWSGVVGRAANEDLTESRLMSVVSAEAILTDRS